MIHHEFNMKVNNQRTKKYGFIVDEVKSLIDLRSADISDVTQLRAQYKFNKIEKMLDVCEQVVQILYFEKFIGRGSITHNYSNRNKLATDT